ncbi:MAG: motB [Proteobacteria bacterium]|nr:motB [Pseudomonadota bacterium]
MTEQIPIVIKKVKKGGHGAHGGAWKLAYADFVTAMMAFFLLLWILGAVDRTKLRGIAEYFKDPWKPSVAGGEAAGDAVSIVRGGGDDIAKSQGQVMMTDEGKRKEIGEAGEMENQEALERDRQQLEEMEEKLEKLIDSNPVLQQFRDQLRIDITAEGLRIQIVDKEQRPMFATASARMEPYAAQIIDQIAPVINELPNRISVTGHTDAKPYSGSGQGYTNWELSADRANAARKELVRGGLKPEKMMRVIGLASSVHLNPADPFDPVNRRIAIIVMNKQTEDAVMSGSGLNVSTQEPLGKGGPEQKTGLPLMKPPEPTPH